MVWKKFVLGLFSLLVISIFFVSNSSAMVANRVNSVLVPDADIYTVGDTLNFKVIWECSSISVTGEIRLPIIIGTTLRYANYVALGSTNTQTNFNYTVQADDIDYDGIMLGSEIDKNGGSITAGIYELSDYGIYHAADTSRIFIGTASAYDDFFSQEILANTTIDGNQSLPTSDLDPSGPVTAMDQAGNYIVVWSGYGNQVDNVDDRGIFAQRYNAVGDKIGTEFRVNSTTIDNQEVPAVAMNATGEFIIAWQSDTSSSGYDIYAQRYDAAGAKKGGEFLVNTTVSGDQTHPAVAMNNNGDFVVVWDEYSSVPYGIFYQLYGRNGDVAGVQTQVNTSNMIECYPAVEMDSKGGFVITWWSGGSIAYLWAQCFGADGTRLPTASSVEFSVTIGSRSYPFSISPSPIGMDAAGNFTIVWPGISDPTNVWAKRYNANGTTVTGTPFKVNISDATSPASPKIAMSEGGEFIVTWKSSTGITARRFGADATASGDEYKVNLSGSTVDAPAISMNSINHCVITWGSLGQDGWKDSTITPPVKTYGVIHRLFFGNLPLTIDEDSTTPLSITLPGILGNDKSINDATTVVLPLISTVQHGSLSPSANGSFTYTPDSNFNGTDTFTYRMTDGTNISNIASVTICVAPVNDLPVLTLTSSSPSPNLSFIENDPATIIDPLAELSDVDGDADWNGGTLKVNISANAEVADVLSVTTAITETVHVDGSGNLICNNVTIGLVNPPSGWVSHNSEMTIYFNSLATNASVQATLRAICYSNTFDAPSVLDRTVTVLPTDKNGGSVTGDWTIHVTAVNDAPELTPAHLTSNLTEDDTTPGLSVGFLLGGNFNDIDASSDRGMAITATTGNGTWQYKLLIPGSESEWTNFPAISLTSSTEPAFLLRADDEIRYEADLINGETATITYRAWDQTGLSSLGQGSLYDITQTGGDSAFSTANDTASLTVSAVNDAPSVSLPASFTVTEDVTTALTGISIDDV